MDACTGQHAFLRGKRVKYEGKGDMVLLCLLMVLRDALFPATVTDGGVTERKLDGALSLLGSSGFF